jgi:DNA-binding CsgD family transcriptional regulator/GAF domain-containing protein
MSDTQRNALPEGFAAGGVALVGFARTLADASTLEELEGAFRAGFGRLMATPMYGFYALDAGGPQIEHNVAVNVSDVFVARYVRAMEVDPLLIESQATGGPVYNLDLMSEAEWLECPVYRNAYSTHNMRHVVEIPIIDDGEILGALHCAASDSERNFADTDMTLAGAVADLLALSIRRIRTREQRELALEQAIAALEMTGTAVATSDPGAPELRLNGAARQLLADVANGDELVHRLLVRPDAGRRFTRRAEVELKNGGSAVLHAHSQSIDSGGLVTVLEVQRRHPSLDSSLLAALTPRESEVAVLVVEGLSDREIAERLCISHYTVHQYVRSIYRALGVRSRVALTRLLLGARVRER